MLELNRIYTKDCLEGMKELESNSIDLIVTDPPYGYSFMGKDWDKAVPKIEIWRECLRVLKDGAFAFVMSAPRQDTLSRMLIRLQEAGFRTDFTSIYWTYASGFPKAMNIGKAVDKKLGVEREVIGKQITGGIGRPTHDGTTPSQTNPNHGVGQHIISVTVSTSEQAKSLDGSYGGFQPKPAVEVIIVAMKPLSEKTFVDQAMKNRKGITWLDDGRIPITDNKDVEDYDFNRRGFHERANPNTHPYEGGWKAGQIKVGEIQGRFPANLLVSDDALNDGRISKSIRSARGGATNDGINNDYGKYDNLKGYECGFPDSGSFSRYFDLDKWFDKQIENLPKEVRKVFPFLITPKASKSEKNEGLDGLETKLIMTKNIHPTVKPLKLFTYLITLGSRKNDLILDPFAGSGTIGVSASLLCRNFIGFEIMEEYSKIANARIKPFMEQKKLHIIEQTVEGKI